MIQNPKPAWKARIKSTSQTPRQEQSSKGPPSNFFSSTMQLGVGGATLYILLWKPCNQLESYSYSPCPPTSFIFMYVVKPSGLAMPSFGFIINLHVVFSNYWRAFHDMLAQALLPHCGGIFHWWDIPFSYVGICFRLPFRMGIDLSVIKKHWGYFMPFA